MSLLSKSRHFGPECFESPKTLLCAIYLFNGCLCNVISQINVFPLKCLKLCFLYPDVIMSAIASQITGVAIVYSTFCSGADQRKHPSSASLAFVRGIHRWPVNSARKGPVTRKMFPFDDVIMSPKEVTFYIQYAMDPTRFRIHDITQHAFSTLSIFSSHLSFLKFRNAIIRSELFCFVSGWITGEIIIDSWGICLSVHKLNLLCKCWTLDVYWGHRIFCLTT